MFLCSFTYFNNHVPFPFMPRQTLRLSHPFLKFLLLLLLLQWPPLLQVRFGSVRFYPFSLSRKSVTVVSMGCVNKSFKFQKLTTKLRAFNIVIKRDLNFSSVFLFVSDVPIFHFAYIYFYLLIAKKKGKLLSFFLWPKSPKLSSFFSLPFLCMSVCL